MEDVEKTVLKMIGSQANQNQYSLFKMKACWKEIIGHNNAKHCGPVKLERRILTLQVDSSVWANQFLYYKNQFIQQINTFIGTDYVKDIKFTQGKNFKKGFKNKGETTDIRETKLRIPPATEEEKKGLQLKFSHIADDKIRNAIIGVEETKLGLEKLYREGVIKKCPVCGSFLKNNETICYACEIKMKQELEYKLWSHILKEPWIQWYDLQKAVKCSETDFTMIKNDIKNYYFEKIRTKTTDSQEIKLGIQKKKKKPLALISEKEDENILKKKKKGK